jgi:Ca-activated chloride channel family protein
VDRLTVLKAVMNPFIDSRVGDRLGLILFGSQAYLQTPLTFDRITVKTLLNESRIGIAGDATAMGDAIGLGLKRLMHRPNEKKVLILVTDGANTAGELSPRKAAELAAQKGLTVYTIGVGADEMNVPGLLGSSFGAYKKNPSKDLDEALLTDIAQLTGGRYFRARSAEDLAGIYQLLDELEPVELETETFRPQQVLYFWPLGFAFILSVSLALFSLLPSRRIRAGAIAEQVAE